MFSRDFEDCLDFSDEALLEMYESESYGTVTCSPDNGFYHGKKWMDVTVAMWIEDLKIGTLTKRELYDDDFPDWWLDKVLP